MTTFTRRSLLKTGAGFAAAGATLGLAAPSLAQSGDIVDVAVGAGTFTTLVAAVQAAGLVDALKAPGPLTVFAPTDDAFAALPAGTVESLLEPGNRDQLVNILTYHVAGNSYPASQILGNRGTIPTLQGSNLIVDGTGSGVTVGGANVITPDVVATNGVIHVIDAVLLP
ncbi:MAG: fasciclin domain-containing protein [Pseudomonadota bacterium]